MSSFIKTAAVVIKEIFGSKINEAHARCDSDRVSCEHFASQDVTSNKQTCPRGYRNLKAVVLTPNKTPNIMQVQYAEALS